MKGLPSSNDSQRSALLLSRCEATDSSISAERMSVVVDELHLTFLSAKVLLEHWNSPELSSEQRAERVTHLQSKIQQVADISLGRGNSPRGDLQTPNDRTPLYVYTWSYVKSLCQKYPNYIFFFGSPSLHDKV